MKEASDTAAIYKGKKASMLYSSIEKIQKSINVLTHKNDKNLQMRLHKDKKQYIKEVQTYEVLEASTDIDYPKLYTESEIVIALIGTVGTNLTAVVSILEDRLGLFSYSIEKIRVSSDVIGEKCPIRKDADEYERICHYMDNGNKLRKESSKNSILAFGIASKISDNRIKKEGDFNPRKRVAYIISSLKHPDEVDVLREIYGTGFFLVGVSEDVERRTSYLTRDKGIDNSKAKALIERDENEGDSYGQHTRDAFHMSDFFVQIDENDATLKNSLWRILDIIFGSPYITPTFDEYAMFQAFVSSSRSADLSRQVGAVITNSNSEIIAYGANDCPKPGGGLYWPILENHEVIDEENGRDYMRGFDSNKSAQKSIIDDIINRLKVEDNEENREKIGKSKLKELTEYGRIVHAEMEALLMCSRNNISTREATLYCTTFPCHNCAKHIIAAGVKKVVYVEPYPKSKAFEFYSDAITSKPVGENEKRVCFTPFIGVGPRRFFDLFSISLGSGYKIDRKDKDGAIKEWKRDAAILRTPIQPFSYIEKELQTAYVYKKYFE